MDVRQERRHILAVAQIILTRVETSPQGNCGVAPFDCQLLLLSPATISSDYTKQGLPEPGQVSGPRRPGPCCISSPLGRPVSSADWKDATWLTVSCRQLVLKPGLEDIIINTDSSKFNQLMSLMPRLRELNIHLKVPLGGMLSEGQLPLVKTLSVPINQVGAGCEATSIIQACPNVTRLRLNISGPVRFQTVDTQAVPRVCRPEARRALEAAAALKRLRDLELSKFPTRDTKRNARDGLGQGWVPGDLQGTWSFSMFTP